MKGKNMKFRANYEKFEKKRLDVSGPGRTKQEFKDECDINTILKNYMKTGRLPDMIKENPQYGDFTDATTYQDAMNVVAMASEQFAAMDAHIRSRFGNDPVNFLAFAEDPRNGQEMINMGLATKREIPETPPKATGKAKETKSDEK
jgi:phage internal scaffolding protein